MKNRRNVFLRIEVKASCYYERVCLPGTLVPSATKAMAVTESLSPTEHPKAEATSPMMAVRTPIHTIDITKQSQPPNRSTSVEEKICPTPPRTKKEEKEKGREYLFVSRNHLSYI